MAASLLSFPLEFVKHVIEKRKPDAKPNSTVALFPLIPRAQSFYPFAMWLGNYLMPNAGFIGVTIYLLISLPVKLYWYKRYSAELKCLSYIEPVKQEEAWLAS